MKFKKTILKNGLRIITVPMKDNPTVTVLVLVEAGSKYETKRENGLSHFLEHMCFKGTAKRPKAIDIVHELDGLGAHYNAFTGHEYTGYYAKAEAKHFPKLLDVVSDIYLNSTFPDAEIQKEKGVIVEEINMYEDMPHRRVQDLFLELLYGDQPAGWNIAGTRENVRAFVRDDFVTYKEKTYVAEATTVIVAGNINEKIVGKSIREAFKGIASIRKAKKLKTIEKQKSPATLLTYKKTDQAHFVLGVRAFDVYDKRNATLSVLGTVLGGGMSSRLFQKLREEMGVGYYVRATTDPYTDHGVFQVSAGVDTTRIHEVLGVILSELTKLTRESVSVGELQKVKDYMIGSMKLGLESSDDIANFFGGQEVLHKELQTIKDIEKKINAVTAGDIKTLAKKLFKNELLNLAVIGPYEDKASFQKILKF